MKIINGYIFNYLNVVFFKLNNDQFDKISENEFFYIAIFFAPLIETLIFQLFLYRFLKLLKIKNTYIIILIMSLAFSQAHWYHWLYVVAAFVNALLLNTFYLKVYKLKNEFIAVLLTIILHSSYNLYGCLFVR
ncbi:CPBP family glutamic-type intramembrane protease [Pedobacter chinensis]